MTRSLATVCFVPFHVRLCTYGNSVCIDLHASSLSHPFTHTGILCLNIFLTHLWQKLRRVSEHPEQSRCCHRTFYVPATSWLSHEKWLWWWWLNGQNTVSWEKHRESCLSGRWQPTDSGTFFSYTFSCWSVTRSHFGQMDSGFVSGCFLFAFNAVQCFVNTPLG